MPQRMPTWKCLTNRWPVGRHTSIERRVSEEVKRTGLCQNHSCPSDCLPPTPVRCPSEARLLAFSLTIVLAAAAAASRAEPYTC